MVYILNPAPAFALYTCLAAAVQHYNRICPAVTANFILTWEPFTGSALHGASMPHLHLHRTNTSPQNS